MKPPCFPMRPGWAAEPIARPGWAVELKLNGWRCLLHVGTGALLSRQLQPLRHASRWAEAASALRSKLQAWPALWLDCEALGIRTRTAGLVVLDVIREGDYSERRQWLEAQLPAWAPGDVCGLVESSADPVALMARGREENARLGELLVEGVVCKCQSSPYEMQNLSAGIETAAWQKYRFQL